VDELKNDPGKMQVVQTAFKRLTGAIANLGRKIRQQVKGPTGEGPPVMSTAEPKVVQAAFVTRYLIRGSDGKLRFGERRG
jgi:hypothetical protein